MWLKMYNQNQNKTQENMGVWFRAAQSGGLGGLVRRRPILTGRKMVSKSGWTDFLASKADQKVKQHISNHTEHEL